jgi:cytochrome c oxidase subunit 2
MNLRARFDHTFSAELIIAYVVAGAVVALLLFAIIRSFTPWGKKASQKHQFHRVEAVYLSVVSAVVGFLIFWAFDQNAKSADGQTNLPYRMTVNVTAFQWCWRFAYAGTPVSVTSDCVDGRYPTLVVPSGESIRFRVTSVDVIHGYWIPVTRFKLWAYPNYVNSFESVFPSPGQWFGECSEFCGLYHYAMKFELRVLPPAEYHAWLSAQERAAVPRAS